MVERVKISSRELQVNYGLTCCNFLQAICGEAQAQGFEPRTIDRNNRLIPSHCGPYYLHPLGHFVLTKPEEARYYLVIWNSVDSNQFVYVRRATRISSPQQMFRENDGGALLSFSRLVSYHRNGSLQTAAHLGLCLAGEDAFLESLAKSLQTPVSEIPIIEPLTISVG